MILAQAFSRFVFDLDGVIWRGDEPLPGAPETVRALRDAGKQVCFVTNNSSELAETYAKKLARMGAGGAPEEVVTSADATARLIEREVPGARGRLAFVVGGEGLRTAIASLGMRIADGEEGTDASVVAVGLDRSLTFDTIRIASLAIARGAAFVASNTDATYPAPEGFWPGAGSIVAAVATATGARPLVAGKPDPAMLEIAADRLGGAPALVVGDRVETDILCAHAAGWPSAIVLTGVTSVADLAAAPAWPDFIVRTLSELLEDRPHPVIRPAAGPDLPQIATILHAAGLISGAARERLGRTVVGELDRRVIATAAWEVLDDAALLRSVAVLPEHRGSGVGVALVAGALRRIATSGIRDVYLVTQDAEKFFASCGFARVDRDVLPQAIASHPQITRECPASAPAMSVRLGAQKG